MLDDFRLRIFKTLAEEGSFTRTAARLEISQPAVSQNIAELERLLSRTLFERQRGSVTLTEDGEVFMKYADAILESYSETARAFADVPSSNVRISASEEVYNHIVSPVLQDFIKVHPEVSFERCIGEGADLAILLQPASSSRFQIPSDTVMTVRWSMSNPSDPFASAEEKTMGSPSATHEKTISFDLLYQPSKAFSCTRLCRILKEFMSVR